MLKEIGAFALFFIIINYYYHSLLCFIFKTGLRWKAGKPMNIMVWGIGTMEERKATNLA
jgi:hypothetical protein